MGWEAPFRPHQSTFGLRPSCASCAWIGRPSPVKHEKFFAVSGLAQPRNEARGRAYVNDVQDEQWIGSRRHDVVPGASCGNRCQCASASFHRPPNFQSTTSKFLLPSLCKTMECTAGYSCPGTLPGILQTAGVPDQPLRLKLTDRANLLCFSSYSFFRRFLSSCSCSTNKLTNK